MDYKIIYQKRKTMGIYVTKNAEIEVRCPKKTPKKVIDDFVKGASEWIDEALKKKRAIIDARKNFSIGDSARFMGDIYPVERIDENKAGFDEKRFFIPKSAYDDEAKAYLSRVYKESAKIYITRRVWEIAEKIGKTPSKVGITSAKTRWGSCGGKGNVNFSWRLIMASEKAIDYVIIHELSHITERNHSARFWDEVKKFMPDYAVAKKELAELAEELARENWD